MGSEYGAAINSALERNLHVVVALTLLTSKTPAQIAPSRLRRSSERRSCVSAIYGQFRPFFLGL